MTWLLPLPPSSAQAAATCPLDKGQGPSPSSRGICVETQGPTPARRRPRPSRLRWATRCPTSLTDLTMIPCNIKVSTMPAHKKPTPERYCEYCKTKLERKRLPNGDLEYLIHFNRRKYCGRLCMGLEFDSRPVKPDPNWSTAHYHARKACPPGDCSSCGKKGRTDVHHKDENWRNNCPSNLVRVCRSCHTKLHRRCR